MSVAPSVIPIAGSNIVWDVFIKDTTAATGKSPVRSIDASGLRLSAFPKYIAALGEIKSKQSVPPMETLQDPGSLLRHLSFSFIVVGRSSLIFRILELTDLSVTSVPTASKRRYAICSGTLEVWRDTVKALRGLNDDCDAVSQTLLEFFSRLGLKPIFREQERLT